MMVAVLILLCVVGSAFFAGMETGAVTSNKVTLRAKARRGDGKAQALLDLLRRPERLLTSFLVGNTLANIGGGALASAWAVSQLGEARGSLLATLAMTAIFLVFSEAVPKMYFRQRGTEALPRFLWLIRLTTWVFKPVVVVAAGVLVVKLSGATLVIAPPMTRKTPSLAVVVIFPRFSPNSYSSRLMLLSRPMLIRVRSVNMICSFPRRPVLS